MNRRIYRKSVAPHQFRVGADGGVPVDDVQAAILLALDNQEWEGKDKFLFFSPHITGVKERVSGINKFATKGYSNSGKNQDAPLKNLLINTEEIGVYNKTNLTTTDNAGLNHYGLNTAEKLIPDATSGQHRLWGLVATNGTEVTLSCFLKADGINYCSFAMYGGLNGSNIIFNLSNGTINSTSMSSTITSYGNGWYRCSIKIAGAIGPSTYFIIPRSSNNTSDYSGDGVSGILACGWQIEYNNLTEYQRVYTSSSLYDGVLLDLTQTTANSQPYTDKIAPSEPLSIKNQNGDSRFMSFPAISFAANEKWTVETCLNWNGSNNAIASFIGKPSDTLTSISIKKTTNVFSFTNESGTAVDGTVSTASLIGKNKIIHFVADGGGTLKIFADGVLFDTITNPTNATFAQSFTGQVTASRNFFGKKHELATIPDSLSASRIQYRAALLRSVFPEIPTTRIAGLDVAVRALDIVTTPAGTAIQNVTDNSAWAALTTPAWCHHGNDVALGTVYNKIYNGYAKDQLVADLASSNFGYHIATESEWNTILATGVAGLKAMGTNYWTSANGTNVSGLTLLGGGVRETDGSFTDNKIKGVYWCGDSDNIVTIAQNNSSSISIKSKIYGGSILLIKNY
jgi:hypothetical protein